MGMGGGGMGGGGMGGMMGGMPGGGGMGRSNPFGTAPPPPPAADISDDAFGGFDVPPAGMARPAPSGGSAPAKPNDPFAGLF